MPRAVLACGERVVRVGDGTWRWRVICRRGSESLGTSSVDVPAQERAEDYGWRGDLGELPRRGGEGTTIVKGTSCPL